jgi:anti-sigma B factor antagonist
VGYFEQPTIHRLAKTGMQAIGWCVSRERDKACRRVIWHAPQRSIMQLKVTTRIKDGILIVDCTGRIVFGEESSLLRETVKKGVSENNRIVMNLGEVSYIDSGGLGTLVALRTTAQNAGGTIKLTNLTKRVGDLLQVTKLLTVFDVYNSEAEAVESFRKAA